MGSHRGGSEGGLGPLRSCDGQYAVACPNLSNSYHRVCAIALSDGPVAHCASWTSASSTPSSPSPSTARSRPRRRRCTPCSRTSRPTSPDLERELGVTLVDRQTGRAHRRGRGSRRRGPAGCRPSSSRIRADVARLGTELGGDVRFGVIGTTARWLVAGLLDGLREQHPRVRAVVVEATTTSLLAPARCPATSTSPS